MCDQCDYSRNHSHQLTRHNKSIYEGTRYGCDQCDYNFNWPSVPVQHKKRKHKIWNIVIVFIVLCVVVVVIDVPCKGIFTIQCLV